MPDQPKQEDIDKLMKALGAGAAPDPAPGPPPRPAAPQQPRPVPGRVEGPSPAPPVGRMELEPLAAAPQVRQEAGMDLLNDVNVQVRIELGSARMVVQDILKLGPGSVVPLESQIADPINVYVNDRLVARGEVLVVNDNFAVRITEVLPLPRPDGK